MEAYILPVAGAKTTIGSSSSANISTSSKIRGFNFAGAGSSGLIISGAAQSPNIQFGTTTTDIVANTTFTAQVADQETGSSPTLVETLIDGSQQLGYGRIKWNQQTKALEMYHRADDALISSSPRVQLYTNRIQHITTYFRTFLEFSLGTPSVSWMEYSPISGLNSALIFQIKNDANEPNITLDIVTAQNGDTTKRDLIVTYRATAGSSPETICRVTNIEVGYSKKTHVILDFLLDWNTLNNGGRPYLAFWCNGQQQKFTNNSYVFQEPTVYSTSTTIARPMVGIYRYTRTAKAPDDCGITFHTFRIEQKATIPPLNGAYNLFNLPA